LACCKAAKTVPKPKQLIFLYYLYQQPSELHE
jgi:hypothetical protein